MCIDCIVYTGHSQLSTRGYQALGTKYRVRRTSLDRKTTLLKYWYQYPNGPYISIQSSTGTNNEYNTYVQQ